MEKNKKGQLMHFKKSNKVVERIIWLKDRDEEFERN